MVRSVALAKPRFALADMQRARPVTVLAADRQFAKRGITETLSAIACRLWLPTVAADASGGDGYD